MYVLAEMGHHALAWESTSLRNLELWLNGRMDEREGEWLERKTVSGHSLGVTADFTTHGGSHLYGLPCLSAETLDPMDYVCTFYVSKIIPKNTHYLLYVTFIPFITYILRYYP